MDLPKGEFVRESAVTASKTFLRVLERAMRKESEEDRWFGRSWAGGQRLSKTTCLRFHAILPKFCGALSPSTATKWLLLIGSLAELHRQRAHFAKRSKAVPAGLTLTENSQGF